MRMIDIYILVKLSKLSNYSYTILYAGPYIQSFDCQIYRSVNVLFKYKYRLNSN